MSIAQSVAREPALLSWGRIGVGVDSSDNGRAALAWACREARADPAAHVSICHAERHGYVVNLARLGVTDRVAAERIHAARVLLRGHHVEVDLTPEEPVKALLALADRCGLLVVGGHSRDEPLYRSTAARVAAHAPAPVVVVRSEPPAPFSDAPFAGHVVVGVDGSVASRAALRFGFQHALRHGVPLAAVCVTDAGPGDFWFDDTLLETHFVAEPEPLALLATEVEPIAGRFPTVPVKRAVCTGTPADALRRAAVGACLLAVGRHGHRVPTALRLGSVSQSLVHDAGCVVAVVP